MGHKTYKPFEDVCIECGKYFKSHNLVEHKLPILGKVKVCRECRKKLNSK